MPEVLSLIPARGGSKSIPRKNLLRVCGKPLVVYAIEHALGCAPITRTVVSTDDDEIAEVARAAGAEVPFRRPAEYASDTATDLDVFRHALSWLRDAEEYEPELVVHLRPTGPVRDVARIERAIAALLARPDADALRSIELAEQTPYKMWRIENGLLKPVAELPGYPEVHSTSRHELPLVYWQNGYVDVVRPRTVLELGSMCGRTVLPFVIDAPVPDLDYPDQIPAFERAVQRARVGDFRRRPSERVPT